MHSYFTQEPIKADGEDMNYCLPGCIRGTCQKNNKNNYCKHDFQCQSCQDEKTNMFYATFDDERNIIPLYEEEHKLSNKQELLLNNSIRKNNIYIDNLNDKIKILNS